MLLPICLGIFLVSMLFVPPSIPFMVPEAETYTSNAVPYGWKLDENLAEWGIIQLCDFLPCAEAEHNQNSTFYGHSATVSFDKNSYAVGDTAVVTVVDADLNTDSSIIEVYTGNSDGTALAGTEQFVITCNDGDCASTDPGTVELVEDGVDSDTFIGVFTVPNNLGQDLEIAYTDDSDATGSSIVWYATSTISSTTGTVSLDRQVYPVPFTANEMKDGANNNLSDYTADGSTTLGNVTVWVQVTDPDLEWGANAVGSVKLITSGTTTTIFTFGGETAQGTELGPMAEVEQGSNVYEISFTVAESSHTAGTHQVLGGSTVIQVQYVDAAGDNGLATNLFDSAIFDLRNGSLTTDKSVYIMGHDMVLTLTDPDLDLNSDSAETYTLGLIEWDSVANSSLLLSTTNTFTANPTNLEETGDSTGVFQTVITIPTWTNPNDSTGTALELGEVITLTYRDTGLAGESEVNADSVDVEATISISNFGASITLDKTVYDWTDTVNIEVIAPDHNKNSNEKETIGTAALPVKVSTRSGAMCTSTYLLEENGEDTGVFVGYIVLTGFDTQNINGGQLSAIATTCGTGTEDGKLQTAGQDDGVTVTYEYTDGSVALASAIIQWNFASVEFLDSNVSSSGSTVIRVVEPDEDLDDEVIDQITVDIYSDSDSGGLVKTLSETDEGTGIFEGTISFSTSAISQGNILRVSEGDTVTAEYTDKQLPGPYYTSSDDLLFTATTTVGTASFPPLERAPAANARVVDASGNSMYGQVVVDQQVQIAADMSNGTNKDQQFAYLVQVRDSSNVPVSLSWLNGYLTVGQSMTAAQSWTPTNSGSYTATVFVWESVDNPSPLSPPVSTTINVDGGGSSIFSVTEPVDEGSGGTVEGGPITLRVANASYDYGEEIRISGNVENYDGTSHITILVFEQSGNLVAINQIVPNSSGAFSTNEIAAGMFKNNGTYTVKAQLGNNCISESTYCSNAPHTTFQLSGFIATEPIPSLTTYTDSLNRFTIDVPSGWVQSNYDPADGYIVFEDNTDDPNVDFDVHGGIIVWHGEGLGTAKQGQLNSENLESIEDEYAAFCNDATMETDGNICYNYQLLSSVVVPFDGVTADQVRTKYMIAESWTIEWDDGITQDRLGSVYQVLDGDNVWEIITWWDDGYHDVYAEALVSSSLTFLAWTLPEEELEIQPITSLTTYTDPQGRYTIDVPSDWNLESLSDGDVGFYDTDSGSWHGKILIIGDPNWGAVLSAYSDAANVDRLADDLADGCNDSSFANDGALCYNHISGATAISPFDGFADQTSKMYTATGTYWMQYNDPVKWPDRSPGVEFHRSEIVTQIISGVDVWYVSMYLDEEYWEAYGPSMSSSVKSFVVALEPSMLVGTFEDSYNYGEVIEMYGMVGNYVGGDVNIKVQDDSNGNLLALAQISPTSGGYFTGNISGNFGTGTYTLTANYQGITADASFEFLSATLSNVIVQNAPGSATPGCEETNECFIPGTVTVVEGGTVTWENNDSAAHTSTSTVGGGSLQPSGVWDSSLIMAGQSFSVTLNTSGTYDYFCMVHPWMQGTVVVGDGIGPEPVAEAESVCESGVVLNGVCQAEIVLQPDLDAYVGQSEYNIGDEITVTVGLTNTVSNEMIVIDVSDPIGNPVVTRSVTVSPGDSESIEFRISDNFLTGSYTVVASSTIDGETITDTTFFKIKSQYNQFQISSVEVTDQQGNTSTLTKGTLGYIKVSLTSDIAITALVTVNLFDADLTTLGVGSVRSNIGEGESEIILSFLIPDDAALGDADIFVNAFTNWVSSGGIPLTPEFSITGEISP